MHFEELALVRFARIKLWHLESIDQTARGALRVVSLTDVCKAFEEFLAVEEIKVLLMATALAEEVRWWLLLCRNLLDDVHRKTLQVRHVFVRQVLRVLDGFFGAGRLARRILLNLLGEFTNFLHLIRVKLLHLLTDSVVVDRLGALLLLLEEAIDEGPHATLLTARALDVSLLAAGLATAATHLNGCAILTARY